VIFTRFCVPETKGKSLEEIEEQGTHHGRAAELKDADVTD
jgi:hypothetical protein